VQALKEEQRKETKASYNQEYGGESSLFRIQAHSIKEIQSVICSAC